MSNGTFLDAYTFQPKPSALRGAARTLTKRDMELSGGYHRLWKKNKQKDSTDGVRWQPAAYAGEVGPEE